MLHLNGADARIKLRHRTITVNVEFEVTRPSPRNNSRNIIGGYQTIAVDITRIDG